MIMSFMVLLGLGGGIIVTAANALVSDISEIARFHAQPAQPVFSGLGGLATPRSSARIC